MFLCNRTSDGLISTLRPLAPAQNRHEWLLEAVSIINPLLITINHFQLNKSCPCIRIQAVWEEHSRDREPDLKAALTWLQQVSLAPGGRWWIGGHVCTVAFTDTTTDRFIGSMARRLSSLESLLSVVITLLLLCCVALIVLSSLSLKPRGDRRFNKLIDSVFRYDWSMCCFCHWCRRPWAGGAERSHDHHRGGRFLRGAVQLQQSVI